MIPKPNKKGIIAACEAINKKTKGMLVDVGDTMSVNIPKWSTGIEDLDAILGGGVPYGRILEIFGPEASGKTSLLYHLLAQHEIALDIPAEGTFDVSRAKLFGNRKGQLKVYRNDYGEDAMNKMVTFTKLAIPIIGLDSVPGLRAKEDVDKLENNAEKNRHDNMRISGTARILAEWMPSLVNFSEKSGTTIIFINQERVKIGGFNPTGGESLKTMGGKAIPYFATIRIKVSSVGYIQIKNYNPANSATYERIGIQMKCRTVKNKLTNPMQECIIPLFFDRGFVSFADMDRVRKEIMAERKEMYSGRKKDEPEELDDSWGDEAESEGTEDDWDK